MTSCAHVEVRLVDHLDDELAPDERAAVEAHLAECEACRATAASYRALRTAYRGVANVEVPSDVQEQVLAAARRSAHTGSMRRVLVAAAAMLVFALTAAWLVTREGPEEALDRVVQSGDRHRARSEYDLAEKEYVRALAMPRADERKASLLHRLVQTHIGQQSYELALQRLDELEENYPDYETGQTMAYLRVFVLVGLGEVERAMEFVDQRLADHPELRDRMLQSLRDFRSLQSPPKGEALTGLGYL